MAKEFGVPVQLQRFWIWAKRQNHTYRPNRPLTPQEELQPVVLSFFMLYMRVVFLSFLPGHLSNTPTIIVSDHPLAFCYYVIVLTSFFFFLNTVLTSYYLIFWVPSVSTTAVLNLLFVSISEFPSTGFSVCFEKKLPCCIGENYIF